MVNRKRTFIVLLTLIISAAILSTGCAKDAPAAPKSNAAIKSALESGKKTFLFFLNPKGGPCQLQDVEMKKLVQTLGDKVNVVYVSALDPNEQKVFYDYGIRSLPSLVLVDSKGGVAKYFSPGIHKYDELLKSYNSTK